MPIRKSLLSSGAALALACVASGAWAQSAERLVTTAIDPAKTVALSGNTRPEAIFKNDRGRVDDSLALDHMQLLLNRPAAREAALDARIAALTDTKSPQYHHWLTAAELTASYGPATDDTAAVTGWLRAQGFSVDNVHTGGMVVDFSGNAGQVARAFGTEIHALSVAGVSHIANMADPKVPAALAGIVHGVVSLNDFRPHTNFKPRPAYTFTSQGGQVETVAPADLAVIYNLNPLFAAGITGQGQTIVVIEDTNVYAPADWHRFRNVFGLAGYTAGSFTQVHPTGSGGSCGNPGVVPGNEGEAELDAEWASAAAPSAAIELASCSETSTTFGGLIALQNLLDGSSPPAIVSISYGECEEENGAAANASYNNTYQQAAALGVSVFVSSGDEGAASCDADRSNATHGITVSGFASTPYNVAVGGTDFADVYLNKVSTYWTAANKGSFESARSYIPEIPWNDSCAGVLLSTTLGDTPSYGSNGFCNSQTGVDTYLTTTSGSGGPSGCATGAASISGVKSGTCKGYAKPSWQALVGNNPDKVRDIPDVSLFAANGLWGHYFPYCDSDINDHESCTGAPSGWSGAGGTSFSSPILAAMQALVNQKQGERQGNPNPIYYGLAATEYGTAGNASCSSTLGHTASASCVFYDVRLGDMDVNCTGTHDCYNPGGTYGVLSTSDTTYTKAYGAHAGWDFATGIGTVNATNLVNAWPSAQ